MVSCAAEVRAQPLGIGRSRKFIVQSCLLAVLSLGAAGLDAAAPDASQAQVLRASKAEGGQNWKSCKTPSELLRLDGSMPRLSQAFRGGETIRIVALGSSSTQGTGASSQAASYPARLLIELQRRFPKHQFEVINLGIGGQLATDMVARINKSVVPLGPELVIWQTGVNDAIRGVNISNFRSTLETGLDLLQKHRIDVVLLNHQYYPGAARLPNFASYLRMMKLIATERKIPLLRRYEIMQHMVTSSQFSVDELLAPDKFHLNDTAYRCLGAAVADALAQGPLAVATRNADDRLR